MDNKYGTLEIQTGLLSMMKKIHTIMVQNNIMYSLCGGTLLGAIRHNGFIPWDDDFDIVMTRKEFKKFLKKYSEIADKPYTLERDGWVWRIRNKKELVNGVAPTIDFFLMDPVPKNRLVHCIQIALLCFLQGLLKEHYYWERYSFAYKICLKITYYLGKPFSSNRKFKVYNSISKWGYQNPSDKCSQFNDQFRAISIKYNSEVLDEYTLKQFEDTKFYITKQYDHYLTAQYGNYMILPPEENRKPMHGKE